MYIYVYTSAEMFMGFNNLNVNKTHKWYLTIMLLLTFNVSGLRTIFRSVNESEINQCDI